MVNEPAKLLPLRFINTADKNPSFDGNFFSDQTPEWKMGQKCYNQKFQRDDSLKLQWISDTPLSDLVIYTSKGLVFSTIQWTASPLTLQDYPNAVIYEIDYPFSALPEGTYAFVQDDWESEFVDVAEIHPNTILIEYSATENDNDVVFDTGIVFQFRVEGGIGNYTPKNQRETYVNQIYSPTQLKSVAHRQFTLYIGHQTGVPEWVLDKANIITQCDELFFDGIQYSPINESEFETIRADDITTFVGGSLDIEPTNKIIKFVTGGNPQQQTIRIVRRTHELKSISGNQSIASIFTLASKLQEVVVYKSGADFTMRVGITPNGNEIGEFLVDNNNGYVQLVNWTFNSPSTVYLSGTGLNADSLFLVYDQMDAPEIPINSTAQDEVFKGATMLWTGTTVERDLLWDLVTGLGKANTKAYGWCISGTNGTQDYNSAYPIGIDVSLPGQDYSSLGNTIGANEKSITRNVLPAEGLGMFTGDAGTDSTGMGPTTKLAFSRSIGTQPANFVMVKGNQGNTINVGTTANMGEGNNFDVRPKSIVSLYVTKIVD